MTHKLKIKPEYFNAKLYGVKNWEYRNNDRGFKIGDFVQLMEWDGFNYTGRELIVKISYIYDLGNGYVIFSDIEEDRVNC